MTQTQVIYLLVFTLLVMGGVLYWQYWEYGRLKKEFDDYRMLQADRKAKVEFMRRELSRLFKDGNYKKKVYLCGILDCLENEIGTKPYTQFWGWVMAQKQANRKATPNANGN